MIVVVGCIGASVRIGLFIREVGCYSGKEGSVSYIWMSVFLYQLNFIYLFIFFIEGDTLTLTRGFSLFGDIRG